MANPMHAAPGIVFFGKIPSRGDFVRSASGNHLIGLIDNWVSQGMELLASDPMWKRGYDSASPIDFAFVGTHNRHVLTGHIAASSDQSSRRFPFVTTSAIEISQPLQFLARCPLLLSRHWHRLGDLTRNALTSAESDHALEAISQTPVDIELSAAAYDSNFRDFLELRTLSDIDRLLRKGGHDVELKESLLALGLLLEPLLAGNSGNLSKGLALPLPRDSMYAILLASFWLELTAGFLVDGEFELSLFMTRRDNRPWLFLDFNGASGRALQALFDVAIGREHHIDISRADWTQEYVAAEPRLAKLASYLEREQLSLRQALTTFSETFFDA